MKSEILNMYLANTGAKNYRKYLDLHKTLPVDQIIKYKNWCINHEIYRSYESLNTFLFFKKNYKPYDIKTLLDL